MVAGAALPTSVNPAVLANPLLKLHCAPPLPCTTLSVWSAINTVPVRDPDPLKDATVKGIVPGPLLLAFGLTVMKLSMTVEDQKQPVWVLTVTVSAPPAADTGRGLGSGCKNKAWLRS